MYMGKENKKQNHMYLNIELMLYSVFQSKFFLMIYMFQGHKIAIPTTNSPTPHVFITPQSDMYIICTGYIHLKAVTTTNIAITVTGGKYILV